MQYILSDVGVSTFADSPVLVSAGWEENKVLGNMPVINMIKTGQNIRNLREQAGLSVRDLQDIFGFATPQAIYKWQHGAAMPTIDNLVVLAAVFEVRMEEILVLDNEVNVRVSA